MSGDDGVFSIGKLSASRQMPRRNWDAFLGVNFFKFCKNLTFANLGKS